MLDRWFSHFPLMGNEEHYAILMPLLAWYPHLAELALFVLASALDLVPVPLKPGSRGTIA